MWYHGAPASSVVASSKGPKLSQLAIPRSRLEPVVVGQFEAVQPTKGGGVLV